MGQITVEKNVGGIEGLCVITPAVHGDNRGYFMETYSQRDMEETGINIVFVQDNQSCSTKGVLRGLHFQKQFSQTKLVRVIKGSVFDVAVDLRKDSKTYSKWYGVELTEENKKQFLIPKGFAHGFLVLSDIAEFCYKCDDFWHPNDEGGLAWNDPAIGIERTNTPKQFIKIGGVPVIVLTLRIVLKVDAFSAVYIAVHPEWKDYLKDMLSSYFSEDELDRIKLVDGGKERLYSFINVMEVIVSEHGLNEDLVDIPAILQP